MFNSLRNSLKKVISKFRKDVEEESLPEASDEKESRKEPKKAEEVKQAKTTKESEEKKTAPAETEQKESPEPAEKQKEVKKAVSSKRPKEPKAGSEKLKPDSEKSPEPETEEPETSSTQEKFQKRGWFGSRLAEAISKVRLSDAKFEELFWEIELELQQNNVASAVVQKIKQDLKSKLVDKPISRRGIEQAVKSSVEDSIQEVLDFEVPDLLKTASGKQPFVILFVGVNGSGKTTTIGKVCRLFQNAGKHVIMVASDTFRAAAIQQLEAHANKLGVKLIKHDYGSDRAAVAFDGIKYAKAHEIDIVLIDTAGRLHTNKNLMDELRKIKRIAKPDLVLYIGESITGNDCIEQAGIYNEEIGLDGIILTKVDVDEKGGTALSISYVTKTPIWLIGDGQNYEDLHRFDSKAILDNLGLES